MRKKITNTAADAKTTAGAMRRLIEGEGLARQGKDPSDMILAEEARGQQELVNSTMLPTKGSDDPEIIAMGFTFGPPDASDPMFRPATLPTGWKKASSDHSMWSYVVDEKGRRRVAVFYKAAFYDRSAHMRATRHSYRLAVKVGERYVQFRPQGRAIELTDKQSWAWTFSPERLADDLRLDVADCLEQGARIVYLAQPEDAAWEELLGPRPAQYETEPMA